MPLKALTCESVDTKRKLKIVVDWQTQFFEQVKSGWAFSEPISDVSNVNVEFEARSDPNCWRPHPIDQLDTDISEVITKEYLLLVT
jgi:hypothetical protein